MNKSGVGVGSASIVLVFAVLCLTIFSLITYVVAGNDKALVDARISLVTEYYKADALAEEIVVNILASDMIPDEVLGVDIFTRFDEGLGVDTVYFFCEISDIKALYINLVIRDDSYDILSWRLYDTDEWVFDGSMNVWTGD